MHSYIELEYGSNLVVFSTAESKSLLQLEIWKQAIIAEVSGKILAKSAGFSCSNNTGCK